MNVKAHYNQLWHDSLEKFKIQEFELDPYIDSEDDTRYGITLLARPSQEVRQNIQQALESVKAVAPNQYYYPDSDLHLTVLSIISCNVGFSLDQIEQAEYSHVIRSAIDSFSSFRIRFRGVTASASCILVQGFPEGDLLNIMRDNLRNRFAQTKLQHSIDTRYRLQTAHMTVLRFKEVFADAGRFIDTVSDLRGQDFGSSTVNKLELVGNDWYQRQKKVQLIDTIALW